MSQEKFEVELVSPAYELKLRVPKEIYTMDMTKAVSYIQQKCLQYDRKTSQKVCV